MVVRPMPNNTSCATPLKGVRPCVWLRNKRTTSAAVGSHLEVGVARLEHRSDAEALHGLANLESCT